MTSTDNVYTLTDKEIAVWGTHFLKTNEWTPSPNEARDRREVFIYA